MSGLSLDFCIYNLTGFFFYTVYAITSQSAVSRRTLDCHLPDLSVADLCCPTLCCVAIAS